MRIFAVVTKILGGGLMPLGPNVQLSMRRGDITDSLRLRWKLPELSDRLTMLEIMLRYFTVHTVVQHNAFYLLFRLFSALSFKVRL